MQQTIHLEEDKNKPAQQKFEANKTQQPSNSAFHPIFLQSNKKQSWTKCDKMGHVGSEKFLKLHGLYMEIGRLETKMNDRFGLVGHIPLFQGVNYVLKTYCSLYSLQNMRKGRYRRPTFLELLTPLLCQLESNFLVI